MKRYFFVPVVIMMIGACSVDEIDSMVEDRPQKKNLIEFISYMGEEEETKTEWQSNGEIWWNPKEDICVFYGNSDKNKFTSTNEEKVKKATFTGTLSAFTGETESGDFNYFWAVYPYDAAESCDGSSVVATLANEQIAQVGTFSPKTNLTLAKSAGLSLAFYNVCAWFRFSVAHEGIKVVTFSGNDEEDVAGTFSVSMDGNNRPTIPIVSDGLGQKEIRLTLPNGEAFEVGENYYFTLLPQTFSSGFTLTFETDSAIGSRSVNSSVEFRRNVYHYGNSFDKDIVFVPNNISFADANFKAYCVENFDTNGDGEISRGEASAVTTINVITDNIESLGGIEYFVNLTTLDCCGSEQSTGILNDLDLSANAALTNLRCNYNQLTVLDVSNNTALTNLYCYDNQLTSLDISNNTALKYFSCGRNQLTSLDVSNNTALRVIYCSENQLTSLDISNNTALTDFSCGSNQLTSLDVSNNTALTDLRCSDNQLTVLDMSNNTALTYLSCYDNQLTSLDVSNNTALTTLWCNNNQLTVLDVSNNTALTYLNCQSNPSLTELWLRTGQTISTLRYNSTVTTIKYRGVDDVPEAVDLGLSVKWASFNLGASKPEEYGDYYAWGETQTKNSYYKSNYKWYNNGSDIKLTKYCPTDYTDYWDGTGTPDGKTVLDLEDDAAYANWGGTWRMPTGSEWYELLTGCQWEWTTYEGTNGYRVYNVENGNSIFLPAAGLRVGLNVNGVEESGRYWCPSIEDRPYFPLNVILGPDGAGLSTGIRREYGFSIRPVTE